MATAGRMSRTDLMRILPFIKIKARVSDFPNGVFNRKSVPSILSRQELKPIAEMFKVRAVLDRPTGRTMRPEDAAKIRSGERNKREITWRRGVRIDNMEIPLYKLLIHAGAQLPSQVMLTPEGARALFDVSGNDRRIYEATNGALRRKLFDSFKNVSLLCIFDVFNDPGDHHLFAQFVKGLDTGRLVRWYKAEIKESWENGENFYMALPPRERAILFNGLDQAEKEKLIGHMGECPEKDRLAKAVRIKAE